MRIAAENGGTVFPMHVVPLVVAPTGMPNYVDIYKDQKKSRVRSSSRSLNTSARR